MVFQVKLLLKNIGENFKGMDKLILPKYTSKIIIPPIKCQGIKTKLTKWILSNAMLKDESTWIEPFIGSGVVGFNSGAKFTIMNDINPHIIRFYQGVKDGVINHYIVRNYLEKEGEELRREGAGHYYKIRERFNKNNNPLDFLFLSRSGFNGVMRFNSKGEFNIPFCKKKKRFSKSYITKIANQVLSIQSILINASWNFTNLNFNEIITRASKDDFIYCDPPYYGRHTDYFNRWSEDSEYVLYKLLKDTEAKFILSTWHSNKYRKNPNIDKLWSQFNILTREHFYHIGAKEENRNSIIEAIVLNYEPPTNEKQSFNQLQIFNNEMLSAHSTN